MTAAAVMGPLSAALTVCGHARDAADARILLQALGLITTASATRPVRHRSRRVSVGALHPLADPPAPTGLTAADLAWMREHGYLREAVGFPPRLAID